MRRLICAFVVRKQQSQGFTHWGLYNVEAQASWPPPGYATATVRVILHAFLSFADILFQNLLFFFSKSTFWEKKKSKTTFLKFLSGIPSVSNCLVLCVWFDSLPPFNNLSVIKGQVFLGWTSTKLGLMCLAQGHNTVTIKQLGSRSGPTCPAWSGSKLFAKVISRRH